VAGGVAVRRVVLGLAVVVLRRRVAAGLAVVERFVGAGFAVADVVVAAVVFAGFRPRVVVRLAVVDGLEVVDRFVVETAGDAAVAFAVGAFAVGAFAVAGFVVAGFVVARARLVVVALAVEALRARRGLAVVDAAAGAAAAVAAAAAVREVRGLRVVEAARRGVAPMARARARDFEVVDLIGETASAAVTAAAPTAPMPSPTASTADPAALRARLPILETSLATSVAASPACRPRFAISLLPLDFCAAASWRIRLASTVRASPSFFSSLRSSRLADLVRGATAWPAPATAWPAPATAWPAPLTTPPTASATTPPGVRDASLASEPDPDLAIKRLPLVDVHHEASRSRPPPLDRARYHSPMNAARDVRRGIACRMLAATTAISDRRPMPLLLIGVGGFAGAIARYLVDGVAGERAGGDFPWGTLVVNVSGSFLLGLLFALSAERAILPAEIRGPVLIGFIGAYTTFSTFMLESWRLIESGAIGLAVLNLGGSIVVGMLALVAGLALGRLG
jgi:CrcB protein